MRLSSDYRRFAAKATVLGLGAAAMLMNTESAKAYNCAPYSDGIGQNCRSEEPDPTDCAACVGTGCNIYASVYYGADEECATTCYQWATQYCS